MKLCFLVVVRMVVSRESLVGSGVSRLLGVRPWLTLNGRGTGASVFLKVLAGPLMRRVIRWSLCRSLA